MDEHIPHAVAYALRRRGIDVPTAAEAGLLGSPDLEYLANAAAARRMLVTRDNAFLRLHDRQIVQPGIAYCTLRTRQVGQLLSGLTLIHELLEADERAGRVEYI